MSSPKMEVKCTVDDCHYNKNDRCHASALEVNPIGDCETESSNGTSCNTFKPDESNYT